MNIEQIKFRGKRIDNREWVYGNLIINNVFKYLGCVSMKATMFIRKQDKDWIDNSDDKCFTHLSFEVIPETVGQYTGMKELLTEDNLEIYAGSIVRAGNRRIGEVKWFNGRFIIEFDSRNYELLNNHVEVIGNIHEHPHLLEKK